VKVPSERDGEPPSYRERTERDFWERAVKPLLEGGTDTKSIWQLVGTDDNPGPLNRIYHPYIFVITPFTTEVSNFLEQSVSLFVGLSEL